MGKDELVKEEKTFAYTGVVLAYTMRYLWKANRKIKTRSFFEAAHFSKQKLNHPCENDIFVGLVVDRKRVKLP